MTPGWSACGAGHWGGVSVLFWGWGVGVWGGSRRGAGQQAEGWVGVRASLIARGVPVPAVGRAPSTASSSSSPRPTGSPPSMPAAAAAAARAAGAWAGHCATPRATTGRPSIPTTAHTHLQHLAKGHSLCNLKGHAGFGAGRRRWRLGWRSLPLSLRRLPHSCRRRGTHLLQARVLLSQHSA